MGFLTDIIAEKRYNHDDCVRDFLSGNDNFALSTHAGAKVNENLSLSLTAIWACVNILSSIMASLPLHVYKNIKPSGKEKATSHPLFDMLYAKPNPEQTSYAWRELMYRWCLLWGVGVSEIEFNRRGDPVALWPVQPWKIRPMRSRLSKALYYEIEEDGVTKSLAPNQLFIIPFFTVESGKWLSPIGVHRETIGSALAVKDFGARTFGQGTNPSAILSGLRFKSTDNEETLRKKFKDAYEGLSNSHRLMLLEEGVKFDRIGLPPEDAQYLETRRFDISEIARIYNVPLFLLQDHEKQTSWGSGIEEQKSGLVDFNLVPKAVQFEQEVHEKLLLRDPDHFVKFNFNGLLRGKFSERIEGYVKSIQNGLMCIDDIQELEDRNPLPDGLGQKRFVPLNMQALEFAVRDPLLIKEAGVNKHA
jgi:HK97 family phage portal protein